MLLHSRIQINPASNATLKKHDLRTRHYHSTALAVRAHKIIIVTVLSLPLLHLVTYFPPPTPYVVEIVRCIKSVTVCIIDSLKAEYMSSVMMISLLMGSDWRLIVRGRQVDHAMEKLGSVSKRVLKPAGTGRISQLL